MSDPGNPSDPNAVPGYGPPQPGWGPPPQPYGYGGYGGYATPARTDGKAIGALVSAIVSFAICPFVPAVVALVLAGQAARSIRESGGQLTGESMVTAARIIAWLNIVICALLVAGFAIFVAAAWNSP